MQRHDRRWTISRKVLSAIDAMEVHDVYLFRGKHTVNCLAYVVVDRDEVIRIWLAPYRDEFAGYL